MVNDYYDYEMQDATTHQTPLLDQETNPYILRHETSKVYARPLPPKEGCCVIL
jgi:hypothetical protein